MVEFQGPVYVTAANLKSPSFVCLTSEVRALCVASCFEVCPQQHGQCSFCCPSVILSAIVLHQIIWLDYLAWESVQRSSPHLYLNKINNWEWRLNMI